MPENHSPVVLKVYDISRGMVQALSTQLLGYALEGVWHTSLLVFNKDFFYGGGVQEQDPDEFERDNNIQVKRKILLGSTSKSYEEFVRFIKEISPKFTEETYDLIKWNCNHFTDACLKFLLNEPLHKEYINQHEPLVASPVGSMLVQMLQGMNIQNPVNSKPNPNKRLQTDTKTTLSNQGSDLRPSLNDTFNQYYRSLEKQHRIPALQYLYQLLQKLLTAKEKEPFVMITLDENDPEFRAFMAYPGDGGEVCLLALGFEKLAPDTLDITKKNKVQFKLNCLSDENASQLKGLMRLIDSLIHEEKMSLEASSATSKNLAPDTSKVPRYALQLEKLKSMGFDNLELCIRALQESNGNIYAALDKLTSTLDV